MTLGNQVPTSQELIFTSLSYCATTRILVTPGIAKFGTVKFTECVEGVCDIPIIAISSPLSKKSPSIFQSINIFAPSLK